MDYSPGASYPLANTNEPLDVDKCAEVSYLEKRAMKLLYSQVLQQMPEHNLTLFEDGIVTAQVASLYLDFKSAQIGGDRFMVVPADFLQAYQHDLDKCVKLLLSSALLPFETSEVKDFDNLVLVVGADNLDTNPPTLFIVRNLRQANNRTPVIHVWKSAESFASEGAMIRGGLSEREIQVQIMLRRLLSHKAIGGGKSYTIESLPSHTIVINPVFTDRVPDSSESKQARSLLQNASNLISKLKGTTPTKKSENLSDNVKKANQVDPVDEAYIGTSPMMTLLAGFLSHGLDPLLTEPRGSMSKVKSSQEMTITRQDFCDKVNEVRDLLYCLYDTAYFSAFGGESANQTLTQSMLIEQISMSPHRARQRHVTSSSEDESESQSDQEVTLQAQPPKVVRARRKQKKPKQRKPQELRQELRQEQRQEQRQELRQEQRQEQHYASPLQCENKKSQQPQWAARMNDDLESPERPQVLQTTPYQEVDKSPIGQLMDQHHDMDDQTAYEHHQKMIKVYRPDSMCQVLSETGESEEERNTQQTTGREQSEKGTLSPEVDEGTTTVSLGIRPMGLFQQQSFRVGSGLEQRLDSVASEELSDPRRQAATFDNRKESLTGAIPATMQAFDAFVKTKQEHYQDSRVATERSSAQFGGGTFQKLPESFRDPRPPMFPESYTETAEAAAQGTFKKAQQKIAVPKAKKGGNKSGSKVRKKGEAIIEQLLQTFQKQQACQEYNTTRRNQPQALRTQMRSRSRGDSSNERALYKLHQLAMQGAKKSREALSKRTKNKTPHKPITKTSKSRSKSQKKHRQGVAFSKVENAPHGDTKQVAEYTAGPVGLKSKLRFKKSPPRSENSDNMIPQLQNVKNKYSAQKETETPAFAVETSRTAVLTPPKLNGRLRFINQSRSKSKESDKDGVMVQASRANDIFDVNLAIPSNRDSLEDQFASTQGLIKKSQTEKALPPLVIGKKQLIEIKKKAAGVMKPRGNSKARLAVLVKGPDSARSAKEEVDASLRKRKEIINELRLSAAKIVIESQEKAKKATKIRQKEAQRAALQRQLHQQRAITTIDQTPIALLARKAPSSPNLVDSDGHTPAVQSPKMTATPIGASASATSIGGVLPKAAQQKLEKLLAKNMSRGANGTVQLLSHTSTKQSNN